MSMEARMNAVETGLQQIREEWQVIRQAPLINGRTLSALRKTQLEHGQKLDEHSRRFDRVEARLGDVDARLGELGEGIKVIVGMLNRLVDDEAR